MKHVVFLVGSYYPNFSAVGTCCYNVAEEIAKNNVVTVISEKSFLGQSQIEEYRGQTILRVTNKWWEKRLFLNERIKGKKGFGREWYKLLLNLVRMKEYVQLIFSDVSINKLLVKSYINELDKIKTPIDVVIPLCFPMEAVVAAMEYKRKNNKIKLIPYLFDPFVESHTLHRTSWNRTIKKKANMRIEKEMIVRSTRIFCMNHLAEHFKQFSVSQNLITFTEHPLMKKKMNLKQDQKSNKEIIITYTGVFDFYIRNPEYFLKIMKASLSKFNAEVHLYVCGNCSDIIDKYVKDTNGKIENHGFVSKQESDYAMVRSNILICIGNRDNSQVPSKIFEYMSAGKPIVLFYSNDEDANIQTLKHYPLSLLLKQDDKLIQQNVDMFIKFCNENKNNSLRFDEVEKLYQYATPKFITEKIIEVINKN